MISFGSISINAYVSPSRDPSADATDTSMKARLDPENSKNEETAPGNKPGETSPSSDLTADEVRELTDMRQRDREVRAHEQAHIAAGGSYVTSGADLEYEEGPDGKKYAVGGEVSIDTSKVPGDPEATLRKMQTIRSAALAPATPSGQDRKVAAQATRIENQVRIEILTQRYEKAAALQSDIAETDPAESRATGQTPQGVSVSLGSLIDISL